MSYAMDYLDNLVCRFPIDIYGRVYPDGDTSFLDGLSRNQRKAVHYEGYRRNDADFEQLLSTYSFSIVRVVGCLSRHVLLLPQQAVSGNKSRCSGHLHATSALLHDLKRYGIGILAEDWSVAAFASALDKARRLMGTSHHDFDGEASACCSPRRVELGCNVCTKSCISRFCAFLIVPASPKIVE